MAIEAIFFDAGFTLVFPDLRLTLAPLASLNVQPTQEQLFDAERYAKHLLDAGHSHGDFGVDAKYWQTFYSRLLTKMEIPFDDELLNALAASTRHGINWKTVRPGTEQALQQLKSRYRLGVISNSDGTIAKLLDELGLGRYFESVTDSSLCGCEKPNARIFQIALEKFRVEPEKAVYIGDVYSVDYVGARGVGMSALLFDAAGVYAGTKYPRVSRLSEVAAAIAAI